MGINQSTKVAMFFNHFTATLIWSFKQQQQQQQHSGVTNLNTTNYVIIIINKKKARVRFTYASSGIISYDHRNVSGGMSRC